MATIRIKQGDAVTLTETITGLTSLAGYTAKLYIVDSDGNEVITKTGSIDTLTITYQIVNEDTKGEDVKTYYFESKSFDTSDHVYTTSSGKFIIDEAIENDPS